MRPGYATMKIKPYGPHDFDDYLRLANELDRQGRVTTAEDFRTAFELPWVDPTRDVALVVEGAEPVGYARVALSSDAALNRHRFSVAVAERLRGDAALLDELIAWCEGRIREAAPTYAGPLRIRTGCYDDEAWCATAVERRGYRLIRYYARMDHNEPAAVAAADVVAGATVRLFDAGRETAALVDTFNRGFEGHFEFYPMTVEQFDFFFDSHWFQADKTFVAEAGGEMVALCLNRLEPEAQADGFRWGVVQQLAVVPAWRGRGLGRALLRLGVGALREAGAERVYLWVDYGNPFGAKELYYGEGFVDRYISRTYAKDE
jgi:mycothiol synthase